MFPPYKQFSENKLHLIKQEFCTDTMSSARTIYIGCFILQVFWLSQGCN